MLSPIRRHAHSRVIRLNRLRGAFSCHHCPVDNDWAQFVSRCQDALGELVEGRPEPFKALWSHADGGEWKVVLRHADELPRKDEQQR